MRLAALALAGLALAACGGGGGEARPAATPAGDAARFLAHVESVHPEPFHATPRAELAEAAAELDGRLAGLSREQAVVELMRLTALLGERDGHSGIFPLDPQHRRPLHLFPLRLYAFPEGLFVVGEVGRRGLVGSRLVAVDGRPVEEIVDAVRPLVPADNDASRRARVPQWLVVAEVLRGLDVTGSATSATFTLAGAGGTTRQVRLQPVAASRWAAAFPDLFHPMVPMGLPRRPRPAYLARRDEDLWTAVLARGRAAYVAYNVTLADTFRPARRLTRLASRPAVNRVILDLRHNPGGNNGTYRPLLESLRRIGRAKPIVVLVSRTTFSAAANLLSDLERTTRLRLVGEPTGGSPNLYGDPSSVHLPASGWQAHVATVWWEKSRRGDPRLAFRPDVEVPLTAAAYFAGRDPVLAAALR